MRITQGTVVGGRIIVEGEPLHEGAKVTVLFPEERSFKLSPTDEAALLSAIAEADSGEASDAEDVLSRLHNRR